MILVYKRLSKKQLLKEAKETINQINEWFEKNPTRKVCKAELWYGKIYTIKRNTVADRINEYVNVLLNK